MGTRTRALRISAGVLFLGLGIGVVLGWIWSWDRTPEDRYVTQLFDGLPWYQEFVLQPRIRSRLPRSWFDRVVRNDIAVDLRRLEAQRQLSRLGTNAWPWVPRILKGVTTEAIHRGTVGAEVLVAVRAERSAEWPTWVQALRGRTGAAEVMVRLLTGRNGFGVRYDLEHRRWALRALGEVGLATPDALTALKAILETPDDYVLWPETARIWAALEPGSQELSGRLATVALDPEGLVEVRRAAIEALETGLPREAETRRVARACLEDEKSQVRLAAAAAIWRLEGSSDEVLRVVGPALRHRLRAVRLQALGVISEMGRAARPVVSEVEEVLGDKDDAVKEAARVAVERVRGVGG